MHGIASQYYMSSTNISSGWVVFRGEREGARAQLNQKLLIKNVVSPQLHFHGSKSPPPILPLYGPFV